MERFHREPRPKNASLFVCGVFGLLALMSLFFGCGGGIRGTGGITQVEGRIIRLDGMSVAGATITLIETGDSTISDSSGEFVIQSDLISGELSLLVVAGPVNATVPIGSVSEEAPTLRLELQVDEEKNSVIVVARIVPTPVPTQANTSSSSSSSSSSPEKPDPADTPLPTPTPDVITNPTSTPTPLPTPSPAPTVRVISYSGVLKRKTSGGFIADATVRIVETGASGITNEEGRFNFTTPEVAGEITIEVVSQGKSARATLDVGAASPIAISFEILFIIEGAATPPDFSIEFSTGAPGSD